MKKNPLLAFKFWNAVNAAVDQTSQAFDVRYQDNITLQFSLTGTPTGTLYIQGSDDYFADSQGVVVVPGNWINITSAVIAGADEVFFDGNQLGALYIRAFFDSTGGAGAVTGTVAGKQV